jgi:outer membrane protein OmpA-like peptidoglycan-associated protein
MRTKLAFAGLVTVLALCTSAHLPAAAQIVSPEAQAVVSDARPSAELSEKQLRERIQTLKTALDQTELADSTRKELRGLLRADRAELESRSKTAATTEEPSADTQASSSEEGGAQDTSVVEGSGAATIESVVSSTQPSGDLSDEALQGRLAEVEAGLARGELPRGLKRQLQQMQRADQAEMKRRRQSAAAEQSSSGQVEAEEAQSTLPQEESTAAASTAGGASDEAATAPSGTDSASGNAASEARELLSSSRSLAKLSAPQLRQRLSLTRQLLADRSLPANLRGKLGELSTKLQGEIRRRGGSTVAEGVKSKKAKTTAEDDSSDVAATKKKAPDAERQALALINDKTSPDRLPRDELRRRLETYRTLLASGELSPAVERGLRAKLQRERTLLRQRVTVEEEQSTGTTASKKPRVAVKIAVPEPTVSEAPKLASDGRRATELNERQLNRRILAYRVLNRSDRVSAAERAAYRERLRADRAELRRRLLEDKRRRVAEVRKAPRIKVDIDLGGDAGVTLWAAEASDDEIERQLIARPVRRLRERYPRRIILEQPEQIVTREEVRESLPSVEIDTINFGFNESFVAEEEIADLDRIGAVLERILANHPDEVFLIEGHTDAVGSDEYNLRLSLERARAVKEALLDYYAISPDNLSVVGLGERYLKIPVLEPEQENRRVTVRRMTPLLSEYEYD